MNANFRGKGASPTNDFWHQKSRVPELSYGEKKLPKRLTAWVGCTNVTDRQTTDGRLIAYSKRNVIRWRLLKNEATRIVHSSQTIRKFWQHHVDIDETTVLCYRFVFFKSAFPALLILFQCKIELLSPTTVTFSLPIHKQEARKYRWLVRWQVWSQWDDNDDNNTSGQRIFTRTTLC